MQLSKALQPGLHIPLEEVTCWSEVQRENFSSQLSTSESIYENVYSCSVVGLR